MQSNNDLFEQLNKLFGKCDAVERAVLFGSRARGDFREESDYDIAVFGSVPTAEKAVLRYSCREDLKTLHKIDLIFVEDQTDENLLNRIKEEGIVFYDKAHK